MTSKRPNSVDYYDTFDNLNDKLDVITTIPKKCWELLAKLSFLIYFSRRKCALNGAVPTLGNFVGRVYILNDWRDVQSPSVCLSSLFKYLRVSASPQFFVIMSSEHEDR